VFVLRSLYWRRCGLCAGHTPEWTWPHADRSAVREDTYEAYSPIVNPHDKKEATTFIYTDRTPRGVTFEGFYNWMVHTRAFAESEWKSARQWNPPTMLTLTPGQSRTYGLRFLLAPEIRDIEKVLAANQRPVAVGIPGYVCPWT